MKLVYCAKIALKCAFVIALIASGCLRTSAQDQAAIHGMITDNQNNQPLPFATVSLYHTTDSTLISGGISNLNGEFQIALSNAGSYNLQISMIGYQPVAQTINLENKEQLNIGTVSLVEKRTDLEEVKVIGERIKAKTEDGKTIYYMNKKMLDVSNSGTDMLKHIPGIQVDLFQNISMEGSPNILLEVDGKERDPDFLKQLDAELIDKIEIISTPDAGYNADITGVIRVILKKNHKTGVSAHLYTEVPTSTSEIFIFPTAGLTYNFNKLTIYSSYNGEMSYFNINESRHRKLWDTKEITEITSNQYVRQKNWSHRVQLGIDYFMNPKNQFNFYGFYNPYSREHDGLFELQAITNKQMNQGWAVNKEDTDNNSGRFYSLFYKHIFDKPKQEITFDLNHFNFKAKNTTAYSGANEEQWLNQHTNTVKPLQNEATLRVDFKAAIPGSLKLHTGLKAKLQEMKDRQSTNLNYSNNSFAAHGNISGSFNKLDVSAGIRGEYLKYGQADNLKKHDLFWLPSVVVNFPTGKKHNLKLSYRNSITRPNIYQLNPYKTVEDPFTISFGNPELKPSLNHNIELEYSISKANNYMAFRLFYHSISDAINKLTYINDSNFFETRIYNLGHIRQFGIQFSGALKLHEAISFNPYLKLLNIRPKKKRLAESYHMVNQKKLAFESGLSAIVSFKNNLSASLLFQYNSPKTNIQTVSFSDALYFLSLDKTFNQRFKLGITCAVPFSKSFTYDGNKIETENFKSHYEGIIQMKRTPVILKLKYQFNSGRKGKTINRSQETIQALPKKGF
ncbi:TonB-dependent receptor domain-containing protein [Sunxiuqinia sp. sy24]|uniref:TonB-dependent receptor domain-containing protein n=1 Tax=Sunxiuqinia sp. sy24 TaxID=3461495 RepID=UPI004045B2B8